MIFLSLGAGVQSTVLMMMGIKGEIEQPDHVIFADTGFEPRPVYRHVEWCQKQCEKAGIPFHIVKAKLDMRENFHEMEDGKRFNWDHRPALYMISKTGNRGVSLRQCTRDAKIRPIERKQIELMGHKTARTIRDGEAIVQIGISTDEARRASPSHAQWIERDYPLIDPLKMSRGDCQAWWDLNNPHINLPTSSCIICPYHTDKMWLQMKRDSPEDWKEACEYDERFRLAYLRAKNAAGDSKPQQVFIHRSFGSLRDANLNDDQLGFDLDDEIYCAGGCGL